MKIGIATGINCKPICWNENSKITVANQKSYLLKYWNQIGSGDIAHLQKIECSPIIKNEKSFLSKHWNQIGS